MSKVHIKASERNPSSVPAWVLELEDKTPPYGRPYSLSLILSEETLGKLREATLKAEEKTTK